MAQERCFTMVGVIGDQARVVQKSLSPRCDVTCNFGSLAWDVKNQGFFRTELAQGICAIDGQTGPDTGETDQMGGGEGFPGGQDHSGQAGESTGETWVIQSSRLKCGMLRFSATKGKNSLLLPTEAVLMADLSFKPLKFL